MPQGRRKVPFSGKQKKQQIIAKRQSKAFFPHTASYNKVSDDSDNEQTKEPSGTKVGGDIQKINYQKIQTTASPSKGRIIKNRYSLQFQLETAQHLKELRAEANKALNYATKEELELGSDYFQGYDFPKRPEWSFAMSKDRLNQNENSYFTKYISKLELHQMENRVMSYYEMNLETWRQLWRVLELSDIVLIIVDIRFPTLMFPPALFDYVINDLGKNMILVLNKIDLVASSVVMAWKCYFEEKYPTIEIVMFTSYPGYALRNVSGLTKALKIRRRRGKQRMAIEGAWQVYKACKKIVPASIDLQSWEQKITEESNALHIETNVKDDEDDDDDELKYDQTHEEEPQFSFEKHEQYRNGVVTVGCVGFPNVGKSSLLNAIMGRKVVSVSKTPGHTKYFQTIFLTNTVRLCDCPGLVFPSATPQRLQVLFGSYPIAQLRVPIASVKYLAEHVDLTGLLNVQHTEDSNGEWTPVEVCEAWALKRGFLTAKAARPDSSRAANNILRMALEGQITLAFVPPKYYEMEEFWSTHENLPEIEEIQAFGKAEDYDQPSAAVVEDSEESSEEDEESEDDDQPKNQQNAFSLLNTSD